MQTTKQAIRQTPPTSSPQAFAESLEDLQDLLHAGAGFGAPSETPLDEVGHLQRDPLVALEVFTLRTRTRKHQKVREVGYSGLMVFETPTRNCVIASNVCEGGDADMDTRCAMINGGD